MHRRSSESLKKGQGERLTIYKSLRQVSAMCPQGVGSDYDRSRGLVSLEEGERLLRWEQVEELLSKEFGVSVYNVES